MTAPIRKKLLLLLCISLVLSACSAQNNTSGMDKEIDASTLYKKRPIQENWPDLLIEEKYDQIELRPGAPGTGIFRPDCESISCYVVNHHTGYAFYMYQKAYIEKKEEDKWIFVPMKNNYEMEVAESWSLCGGIKTEMKEYGLSASCEIRDLKEGKIAPGEYRMIIGIGQDVYYMPFTITAQ